MIVSPSSSASSSCEASTELASYKTTMSAKSFMVFRALYVVSIHCLTNLAQTEQHQMGQRNHTSKSMSSSPLSEIPAHSLLSSTEDSLFAAIMQIQALPNK